MIASSDLATSAAARDADAERQLAEYAKGNRALPEDAALREYAEGPGPMPGADPVTGTPAGPHPAYIGDVEITGADWLNYMALFFDRYVTWPSAAARDAAVLWAAHTYAREAASDDGGLIWSVTPRLFVLSKHRDSGKSTVLRLLSMVCPRVFGIETEPTEYGLLMSLGGENPTLLIDELGILIGSDRRKQGVQQILLNGYTKPKVGPAGSKLRQRNSEAERVPLFAPVALAGLDVVEKSLSDNIRAILSRGIILHMMPATERRLPADLDEEEDRVAGMVRRIQVAGLAWVFANREYLRTANPEPARGATRRWRQIWRPILAIADAAGEDWPERARRACEALRFGAAGEAIGAENVGEMTAMLDELYEARFGGRTA